MTTRFLCIAVLSLLGRSALAEPVLPRVIESSGSIRGGGAAVTPGATLPIGASIITGPASNLTFNPFPGTVVSYAAKTEASIKRLDVSRRGSTVARQASLSLENGILFFAIGKVNWDATLFEVLTPDGKVVAKRPEPTKGGTVGVMEVRKGKLRVAVEAGRVIYEGGSGQSIAVNSGSVLSSEGHDFQVVDLTTGQIALYDATGAAAGARTASAAEAESASQLFGKAAELSDTLIAAGALSPNVAAGISETLIAVNERLAQRGMAPVNTAQVGSLASQGTSESFPALAGSPGASSANPANTAGSVISPER